MTLAPDTITHASVLSRETARMVLMLAFLNDFDVKSGNIVNAFVQATVTEMVWTFWGPEFGKDARKTGVIV